MWYKFLSPIDDVYIAAGANAQARVEIGDNSVYEDCTNIAIAVPSAWSDTNVAATLYTGLFSAGFAFVIDASGKASKGHPIKLGGSVEQDGPGQPGQPDLVGK